MHIFSTFQEVQKFQEHIQEEGFSLVFIPTMGALHAGHFSLFKRGKKYGKVLVSIFVNPSQFTHSEDFEKYPRNIENDIQNLKFSQIDAVFIPSVLEVYPPDICAEKINHALPPVFSVLEGSARPGHFDGVYTVLHRFFSAFTPDFVVFGQKDYQQTLLVQYLCQKEFPNISIDIAPIFRESNGLALSSRNERLSKKEREEAKILYETLSEIQFHFKNGEMDANKLTHNAVQKLLKHPVISAVHYCTIASANTLQTKEVAQSGDILLLSVTYAGIHLIDNMFL